MVPTLQRSALASYCSDMITSGAYSYYSSRFISITQQWLSSIAAKVSDHSVWYVVFVSFQNHQISDFVHGSQNICALISERFLAPDLSITEKRSSFIKSIILHLMTGYSWTDVVIFTCFNTGHLQPYPPDKQEKFSANKSALNHSCSQGNHVN